MYAAGESAPIKEAPLKYQSLFTGVFDMQPFIYMNSITIGGLFRGELTQAGGRV
jgi:hypothetical protein